MNDRPTPETDAAEMPIDRIDTVASRPSCVVISDVARRLERERDEAREDLKATQQAWVQVKTERIEALRERDEARDAAEKAKAFKRVMKDDNAKLRRELDELRDDTRVLLKEIFNLTQIGDPHPADLPIKALQAIAEMIDEHLKEARK